MGKSFFDKCTVSLRKDTQIIHLSENQIFILLNCSRLFFDVFLAVFPTYENLFVIHYHRLGFVAFSVFSEGEGKEYDIEGT